MAGSAQESLNGTRPAVGILADQPLDSNHDDLLGFGAFAEALADLIDDPKTDTPLTIAISAPWGAGKTSLAKMVDNRLKERPVQRGEPPNITCWFNAWIHDDAPHLGAAFAAEVAREANEHRRIFHQVVNPLPSALLNREQRVHRLAALIGLSLILSIIVMIGIYFLARFPAFKELLQSFGNSKKTDDAITALRPNLKDFFSFALMLVTPLYEAWTRLSPVARSVAGFTKDPDKKAATGSILEVSNQLAKLLRQATRSECRFVIFVDDLERCRPPRAVEVCEVTKQLLQHRDVVTVLVADMASVAACADLKYSSLEGRYPVTDTRGVDHGILGETYGQEYLQKIVQIRFDLPVPSADYMRRLVNGTREAPHEQGTSSPEEGQAPESADISQRERLIDVVSRRGWKIALGFLLSVTILGLIPDAVNPFPSNVADIVNNILFYFFFILLAATLILALIRVTVRMHMRRRAGRHLIRPLNRVERILDVASRNGWKIALGLCFVLMVSLILLPFDENQISDIEFNLIHSMTISLLVAIAFALIRVVLAVVGLWRRRTARRDRKKAQDESRRIDEQIRQNAKSEDSDVGQLAARFKSQSGKHNSGLVEQRAQRYLTDESQLRKQADEELFPFLPSRPRLAKQLKNHLRVVLTVAFIKGMLGGQPEMTVQHLVKWAILTSRWPELVSLLRTAPEEMVTLEGAADIGELTDRLRELNYRRTVNGDLVAVLRSSAKLAPVMTRLVTYEAVPDDDNVPTTTSPDAEKRDVARVPEGVNESARPSR